MKLGITNCLHLEGYGEARRAVDKAALAYYAALKPKGYKLVLHAVGSSDMDREAAEAAGWQYMERSNDDRGKKRNDALDELAAQCDVIVRIGSDDLLSLALLDEIVRRAKVGREGYWELKGFYAYDLPGDNLALWHSKQFALAIMTDRLQGPSHRTSGTGPDDSGLDVKWRGWGSPYYQLPHSDERPMVAISSGDEIHGYSYYMQTEPFMCKINEEGAAYINKHFPGFLKSLNTGTVSTTGVSQKNASTKKNKRDTQA